MTLQGKYDEFANSTRTATEAEAVITVVLGGSRGRGTGYSYRGASTLDEEIEHLMKLSATLRIAADEIVTGVRRLRQQRRNGV